MKNPDPSKQAKNEVYRLRKDFGSFLIIFFYVIFIIRRSIWTTLKKIRDNCNISIEEKRASKIIGSSLEANIDLKLGKKLFKIAKDTDFAELCITSNANISEADTDNEDILVNTVKAEGNKCPVCWKIKKDKCERQDNCHLS